MNAAVEVLEVEYGFVVEFQPSRERFTLRAAHGLPPIGAPDLPERGGSRSLAGHTLRRRTGDRHRTGRPRPDSITAPLREHAIRSGIAVVIDGRDGPFGVFGVQSDTPCDYTAGDVAFVQSLANVLADALERQTTEDAIEHRALHDPLTGLANRVLFLDRLEHTLERLRRHAGSLPRSCSSTSTISSSSTTASAITPGTSCWPLWRRASADVRPTDTIACFGGDEFGLLLEELTSERDAIAMAERVGAVFARPFVLDANEHFVTTSIGIALAGGGELPAS